LARIPYADTNSDQVRTLTERIVAERGKVLHLYQMLLHSPPVAEGWLGFLTSIRQMTTLPGDLREIIIMRVAHLNNAPYEADQHVPYALKEGVSHKQLDALQTWSASTLFDDKQRAVLAYTDAMTKGVQVPEVIFAKVNSHFTPKLVVEMTATIAAYNMVSRFLEALQIHSKDEI